MLQTQAAVGREKALVSLDYSYLRYLKIWRKTLLKILLNSRRFEHDSANSLGLFFKLINYAGAEERGSRPSSERYINIYCLAVHVRSKRTWNGIISRHSSSRQRNWQKIVMPLKSCCFAHYTYCVFWCSYYHRSFIRSLLIHFTSLQFSFAVTRQVAGDFVLSRTQPRGEYEFSNVYVAVIISKKYNLCPVHTSCFCRAELNCNSVRRWHGRKTTFIQTSCQSRTKFRIYWYLVTILLLTPRGNAISPKYIN